jgi:hypothetical protein
MGRARQSKRAAERRPGALGGAAGQSVNRIELFHGAQRGPDQGTGDKDINRERFEMGDELFHDADPIAVILRIYG